MLVKGCTGRGFSLKLALLWRHPSTWLKGAALSSFFYFFFFFVCVFHSIIFGHLTLWEDRWDLTAVTHFQHRVVIVQTCPTDFMELICCLCGTSDPYSLMHLSCLAAGSSELVEIPVRCVAVHPPFDYACRLRNPLSKLIQWPSTWSIRQITVVVFSGSGSFSHFHLLNYLPIWHFLRNINSLALSSWLFSSNKNLRECI